MGYDIHITRRANWWDDEGPEITTAEWETVVEADAELEMVPEPPGWDGPRHWIAQMITHPPEERLGTALYWDSGEIRAKNPTDILIAKMRQPAIALNAKVQGDDGEYYAE
ncbi:hypothetical protein ACFY1L_52345 [Streptomyces sp. NPDC001663]|uniref:hypothetical protein n=1 Tax=Streptomyces sp. NPDC001663 TaxID=3364597 RepID=UPI0036C42DD2